jgi:hypothetical protein
MIKIINETKNTNVPLTMKSLFLSVYKDRPYESNRATIISINPLIPASILKRLPAMNERI